MFDSRVLVLVAALLAHLSAAQQSGWVANEVNTTMCYWTTPRGRSSLERPVWECLDGC
jgi:hypothetical protein